MRAQNIFLFLFLVIVVAACHHNRIQPNNKKVIQSGFKEEYAYPLWDSNAWEEAIIVDGKKENSENRLFVLSGWDNDSLYFFFRVEDSDLRSYQSEKDHSKLFLDDMVEILIDANNDKDSCWAEDDIVYHVNLCSAKKDDRGTAECKTNPSWDGHARLQLRRIGTLNDTTDVDTGYLLTIVFPWVELRQQPKPGLIMGINFANGDNDGKGRQLFDWVGAWPMRSPYAFGNLELKKEK